MKTRVIHLHIPRTAGSSLGAHLTSAFAAVEIEFESGHFYFNERPGHDDGQRETIIFVVLRDPVDRVVSYYNYVRSLSDHPKFEAFTNNSLIDLLDWKNAPHSQLCNGQTRQIIGARSDPRSIGVRDLGETIHRLQDRNVIVATTDDLGAGLSLLSARTGVLIPPLCKKLNQSQGASADTLTALRILVRNFVDWRIYRMARAGIFA